MHTNIPALFTTVCLLFATLITAALNPRTQCYSGVFTLAARGSDEAQGQSILETIVSGITGAIPDSGSNEVVYPAWSSFWNSAPTGVDDAQHQMQDYYAQCPTGKIIVMGYSQGSYVMSTALAGGNYSGQSWDPLASDIAANGKVAAVVLFGDQSRVLGLGTAAVGTSCADVCTTTSPLVLKSPYTTSMATYGNRLQEWCDSSDPVCCSTGTDIQAHLSYWSDNTTDTVVQFVQDHISAGSSSDSTSSPTATSTPSSTTSATSVSLEASSSISSGSLSSHGTTATIPTSEAIVATPSQVPPSASSTDPSTSDGHRDAALAMARIWSPYLLPLGIFLSIRQQ